jgi:hypothetical protein
MQRTCSNALSRSKRKQHKPGGHRRGAGGLVVLPAYTVYFKHNSASDIGVRDPPPPPPKGYSKFVDCEHSQHLSVRVVIPP